MAQDPDHEQLAACDDHGCVQEDASPSPCKVATCQEPADSDSTEDERLDPLMSWLEHETLESSEEVEEVEESSVAQPAVTASLRRVDDVAAYEVMSPRTPNLPLFDEERYQFRRLLHPSVRNGGQIELRLDTLTGASVAVKHVPSHRLQACLSANPLDLEDPWQEMAVTTYLGRPGPARVPGVCACHGAFRAANGDAMLVSDFLPGGDLFDVASELGEPGPWREQQAWLLIRSLLETIMTIHSRGVAHGDVSVENILRQQGYPMSIALIDFGMAVAGDLTKTVGVRGKPSYQAPEMHTQPFYDARCADLFACGVVAYALATRSYPWSSTRPGSCLSFSYAQKHGIEAFLKRRKVSVGGIWRPLNYFLSVRYKQLLLTLLSLEPVRRFEVSSWPVHGSYAAQLEPTPGMHKVFAGG